MAPLFHMHRERVFSPFPSFSDASRRHDGTQPAGAHAWCCDTMWHQVVWRKPFKTSFKMLAKAYKLPGAEGSGQCFHLQVASVTGCNSIGTCMGLMHGCR